MLSHRGDCSFMLVCISHDYHTTCSGFCPYFESWLFRARMQNLTYLPQDWHVPCDLSLAFEKRWTPEMAGKVILKADMEFECRGFSNIRADILYCTLHIFFVMCRFLWDVPIIESTEDWLDTSSSTLTMKFHVSTFEKLPKHFVLFRARYEPASLEVTWRNMKLNQAHF